MQYIMYCRSVPRLTDDVDLFHWVPQTTMSLSPTAGQKTLLCKLHCQHVYINVLDITAEILILIHEAQATQQI